MDEEEVGGATGGERGGREGEGVDIVHAWE
jgi:hypothetical protein